MTKDGFLTQDEIAGHLSRMDAKLVSLVSRKLEATVFGVPIEVTLVSWRPNRDGSQTPVFRVPQEHRAVASALGLTVE